LPSQQSSAQARSSPIHATSIDSLQIVDTESIGLDKSDVQNAHTATMCIGNASLAWLLAAAMYSSQQEDALYCSRTYIQESISNASSTFGHDF